MTIVPEPGEVGIRPGEPLGTALARVGDRRLAAVAGWLAPGTDPDAAVHLSRKAVKRLRALLRLARGALDGPTRKEADVVLRHLARTLATVRDAAVAVVTLDGIAPGRCPDLRERLEARHRREVAALFGGPASATHPAGTVGRARWHWEVIFGEGFPDRFEAVAPGLERTHRRARTLMERLVGEAPDAAFHEWRKQVKYLRHQIEFLLPLDPALLGGPAADLDRLGELLGAEHDLTVLLGTLDSACPGEAAAAAAGRERRASLREAARVLGTSVLGDAAGPVERARSAWTAAGRR